MMTLSLVQSAREVLADYDNDDNLAEAITNLRLAVQRFDRRREIMDKFYEEEGR